MTDIECLRLLLHAMAQCGNARVHTSFIGQEDEYELYLTYDAAIAEDSQGLEVLVVLKEEVD